MKKILHISKYYFPFKGGVEDVCKSLVDGMPEYEQKVLCFNEGPEDTTEIIDGAEIIRKGIWKELCRQPLSAGFYGMLKRTIKEYKPDIIHIHVPNPLVSLCTCMLIPKQTKLVIHWHSDIIVQPVLYFFFRMIEQWSLRRADKIIITSPNYLTLSAPLAKHKEKCVVVPNVVSLEKLKSSPNEEARIAEIKATYGNKPIVFFMGRHVSYKGIPQLIESEQFVKSDCKILIAGSGPMTPELKEMAKGKDRIVFLGRIPDEDITAYMRAATVFAFPSITKNEAFGVVLAEAMYCGAVPVSFTIPGSGVNWVNVKDETGLEVENCNVKAYAAAIDRLIADEPLREKLSAAARQRVEKMFVMDAVKDSLKEAWRL